MIHRLPADVPESGERYDLVLTASGLDKRKREIAHFVIDNGEYRGVRVSLTLTPQIKQAIMAATDLPAEEMSHTALDKRKYDLRISAVIDVERKRRDSHGMYHVVGPDYDESNVWVTYDLTELAQPEGDSELARAMEKHDKKFERKPKAEPKKKATPKKKAAAKSDKNED